MGRTEEEGRAWRQDGPVMLNVFSQPSRNVGLVVDVQIGVADKIKVRDEKFGDLHGDPQRPAGQGQLIYCYCLSHQIEASTAGILQATNS